MDKQKLRFAVCDDKKEDIDQIIDVLRECLRRMPQAAEISLQKFLSGQALYEANRKGPFQLIFLDIEMPGVDGFHLAEMLCLSRPQTYLIFVSVHENFVFDASEYMPLWFVRKSKLERDMQRAMRKFFQVTASMCVSYKMKDGFGIRELQIQDILYIECTGHSLSIQRTDGSRLEKYGTLKFMEEELKGYHFLRIHKNYLVNQKYIKEVGKQEVYLTDQSVLEMARDRRASVRAAMLRYEREHYGY